MALNGSGFESARSWVKQADVDNVPVAGVTTAKALGVRELEQEVRELRRLNEMAELTKQSPTDS